MVKPYRMDVERNGMSHHNHNHHHHQHNGGGPALTNHRNGFVRCLCQTVLLLRYFPFVMISALFSWGLYVYLYYIIYSGYESTVARVLVVLFFLPLYTLSVWSYLRTVFATNRSIPAHYSLPDSINLHVSSEEEISQALEQTILERNLPVYTRSYNGWVRYCRKCVVIKPDRCHHCSTCGQCVRKMDHHCHWVSNCVAFDNYKYFLQFLTYTVLLAVYTSASSMRQFIKFWKADDYAGRFQVFFLVVFCSVFSLSILFLLSYHIYLVLRNMSTLEAYQPPRFKNVDQDYYRFNLGACRNFRSVFGDNKLLWFVPLPTSYGDGLQFDLRLNPTPFDKANNAFYPNNNTLASNRSNGDENASSPIMSAEQPRYNGQLQEV